MLFIVNFFTPKLMKIRWSRLFFGSFAHHFQIKLSTPGINLNSIFIIMSELKFFLLTRVLTQNFNTMNLVEFLEKNQKLHIQIVVVTLKVTSCRTMSKNKSEKKWKSKILWTKQTFFLAPYPSALGQFQPHGCLRELLRTYTKNELNIRFQNINLPQAHIESKLDVLGVHGKLAKYVVHLSKRKHWKKSIFLHTSCPVFGLKVF
jgi:hypothetical protein